jgi:beta-lactamase class A
MMEEQPKSYIRLGRFVLFLFTLIFISSLLFKGPFQGWLKWSTFNFVFRNQELSKIVERNLSNEEGEFAVVIENLKTEEKFTQNAAVPFPSASLYKLFLMASVLKEIEGGGLKMEDTVSSSKARLTEILGSVDSGYENAPSNISYTVEEALTRIGRVSDNFASIMLTDKIGLDKIQSMADSLGATNTRIKNPTLIVVEGEEPYISTTAEDMATFFKKLYFKQIVSTFVSDKLVEFLSLNQLDNRIPAGLPEDVKVAYEQSSGRPMVVHKTGELARIRHDAGVVYLQEREYIIILMSRDIKGEDSVIEAMANTSKEVYEYFLSKE